MIVTFQPELSMSAAAEPENFQHRIQQVERLVGEIEVSTDRKAKAAAQEVVRVLLDLHGYGLAKLLDLLADGGDEARAIFDKCLADEEISSLLLLHDLHPQDAATRVEAALNRAAPQFRGQGGEVELLDVSEDRVRVRIVGGGCGCNAGKLRELVSDVIYAAAPEVASVEIEEPEKSPAESAPVPLGLPRKRAAVG